MPPIERFTLAASQAGPAEVGERDVGTVADGEPVITSRASTVGTISFATARFKAGVWLAGQSVEVVCDGSLVQLHHRGVLIATHTRPHPHAWNDRSISATRRYSRRSSSGRKP